MTFLLVERGGEKCRAGLSHSSVLLVLLIPLSLTCLTVCKDLGSEARVS